MMLVQRLIARRRNAADPSAIECAVIDLTELHKDGPVMVTSRAEPSVRIKQFVSKMKRCMFRSIWMMTQ